MRTPFVGCPQNRVKLRNGSRLLLPPPSPRSRPVLEHLRPNLGHARADHVDALRGGAREIEDATATTVGTAIVDAHDNRTPVRDACDANDGAEGKGSIRACERAGIVALAVGRHVSSERVVVVAHASG